MVDIPSRSTGWLFYKVHIYAKWNGANIFENKKEIRFLCNNFIQKSFLCLQIFHCLTTKLCLFTLKNKNQLPFFLAMATLQRETNFADETKMTEDKLP